MKKLTDEQILAIERNGEFWIDGTPMQFARAIEAEVLRINAPQYEVLAAYGTHSVTPGFTFPRHFVQITQALEPGDVIALIKGGAAHLVTEGAQPDAESSYGEENEMCENCVTPWKCNGPHTPTPRATGCPDTMDETARFAAEELPGILRKQAG